MLSETFGRKMHKRSERFFKQGLDAYPTALVVKTYGNGHLALEVGDNGPLANKPSNSQNRSKLLRISGAVGVARTVALCWAMEECIISISSHIMACHFASCLSFLPCCLEQA